MAKLQWREEMEPRVKEFRYTLHLLKQSPLALVGIAVVLVLVLVAIFAPLIAPYDPYDLDLPDKLAPPNKYHLFGTDDFGRDIFSRIVYGSRISIKIGILAVGIAFCIGVPLGVVAGYFGGWVDELIMRIMDMMLAFPALVLAMALCAALGYGLTNAMIAIGIVYIPYYARLVRGQALSVRENPYVEAAHSIGASRSRIVFRHVLPNCLSPLVVQATLSLGDAILTAAALSFIGVGAQVPEAEWGAMITLGRGYIVSGEWWLATFPGIAILVTVLGFNLFGDGLRDTLDPRLRR